MNIQQKPIETIFKNYPFKEAGTLPVYEAGMGPEIDPYYLPEPRLLADVVTLMTIPHAKVIGLKGESGTGKTDFISFIASHLNMPLHVVNVTRGLRTDHIMGENELVNDNGVTVTQFLEAIVVKAYRDGGILNWDEIDKLNDELSAALLPIFDKKPWKISTGEVIYPHPNLFIFTTSNTIGEGLSTRYITSVQLDSALRRRITWVKMDYPTAQVEMSVIQKQFPELPVNIINDIVNVANRMRDALLGVERDGNIAQPVGEPFDMRASIKWASFILGFKNSKTLQQTFSLAYLDGVDASDHAALMAIFDGILDDKADKTLSQLNATPSRRRKTVA